MKRINSGTVKIVESFGSEALIFRNYSMLGMGEFKPKPEDINTICTDHSYLLREIKFKFEIKMPFLLQEKLQRSNLGSVEAFGIIDVDLNEAYIPPYFYCASDFEGFFQLTPEACNTLNTKFMGFYRNAINFYHKLLESGLCHEQAQLVLPTGLFTTFYWNINAEDLLKFIDQYYYNSPEMCGYCEVFMVYLEERLPLLSKWYRANKWKNFNKI